MFVTPAYAQAAGAAPAGGDDRIAALDRRQHGLLSLEALLLRAEDQEPEDHDQQQYRRKLNQEVGCAHSWRCTGGLRECGGHEHQ